MVRRTFRKNEVVFHEGDQGTSLFVVERGEVKIVLRSAEGKEAILGFRAAGDFFGEMALLDGEPRSANVIATEPCEVLILRRDDFLRFIAEHPNVAVGLLAILSQRLRSTTRLVHDASFLNIRARVVRAILDLASLRGILGVDGEISIPRLTQEDLAQMVGATRESVNKWLKYYERLSVLTLTRGRVIVKRPQRLRQEIYQEQPWAGSARHERSSDRHRHPLVHGHQGQHAHVGAGSNIDARRRCQTRCACCRRD